LLLNLNDFNKGFEGDRFIFMNKNYVNITVKPRKNKAFTIINCEENPLKRILKRKPNFDDVDNTF